MLNQRVLTYLNEVIRRGSLRRAAAHLDVAPSALSRQIKALEETLDTKLCERHGSGMRATQAGQLLVHHFHTQRAQEEAVLWNCRGWRGGMCELPWAKGLSRI
ncbi:helix-turn-helix domain-containing protein [Vreelandella populi]|uniref:helix-turn-helix domain-containing protein n=1 Tax=Vreelandella populi TaxID=2498858 RepID=UPI001F1CA3C2|nr:LysR family transcriptional regulator [Halomonas populi]